MHTQTKPKMNSTLNINWKNLSGNSASKAIDMLRENIDKIDWEELACNSNPDAMQLFADHFDFNARNYNSIYGITLIHIYLSSNPNALSLLKHRPEIINWGSLARNPNPKAMELIEPKIYTPEFVWGGWSSLSENPNAIHLLEANPEKINWYYLSLNPNAIHLLEENVDKIKWKHLSRNTNPNAIKLIEANPQYFWALDWSELSCNKNAVKFIEKHYKEYSSRINWAYITITPKIEWEIMLQSWTLWLYIHINWEDLSLNPTAINILDKNHCF